MEQISHAEPVQIVAIETMIHDSISRLCHADHQNDPRHLHNWLAERSRDKLTKLIFAADSQGFVCLSGGEMVGVAHIRCSGQLSLCYVHPDFTGRGIGRGLLNAVVSQARDWSCEEISLVSTATARPFYLAHGFEQSAEAVLYIGMPGYPMKRKITTVA